LLHRRELRAHVHRERLAVGRHVPAGDAHAVGLQRLRDRRRGQPGRCQLLLVERDRDLLGTRTAHLDVAYAGDLLQLGYDDVVQPLGQLAFVQVRAGCEGEDREVVEAAGLHDGIGVLRQLAGDPVHRLLQVLDCLADVGAIGELGVDDGHPVGGRRGRTLQPVHSGDGRLDRLGDLTFDDLG
jgi:hypothetical protein